jgi:hypothetical protein
MHTLREPAVTDAASQCQRPTCLHSRRGDPERRTSEHCRPNTGAAQHRASTCAARRPTETLLGQRQRLQLRGQALTDTASGLVGGSGVRRRAGTRSNSGRV